MSSTYSTDGSTFHVTIGFGNVSGSVGQDSFTLGDAPNTLVVTGSTFGVADRLSTSYGDVAFDGVLGLAFKAVTTGGLQPFFQHGVDLGVFDQPIFTIFMKPDNAQDQDVPVGDIVFGGMNTVDCVSDTVFVPITSKVVWWFNVDSIKVSDQSVHTGPFVTMSSIGTAVTLVSPDVLYDLTKVTNANYDFNTGFYEVDCAVKFTWKLEIGGSELSADQSTLVWMFSPDKCYLAFGGWEDDDHNIDIVLGVPFLQTFCVSHDVQKGQIGFSKAK